MMMWAMAQTDSIPWLGRHSVHAPAGPVALSLDRLGTYMYSVAAIVFVLVVAALLWAVFRSRPSDDHGDDSAQARALKRTVTIAAGATVAILFVFLFLSYDTGRAMTGHVRQPLLIRITGHQWWWEVEYRDSLPQHTFTTANEIHIPVGIPVVFELKSNDVIHSLWVPSLAGKRDLIPGQENSLWFQADTAGVYRGQCAEFCGYQHAKMAFQVIAEPQAQFARWLMQQRDTAPTPSDSLTQRGREVFVTSACVMCHTIQGTTAGSRIGPDLTHLASRRTIAAGTMSNTPSNLFGWIVNPQAIKPGTQMPAHLLAPQDLAAVVAYLETLR